MALSALLLLTLLASSLAAPSIPDLTPEVKQATAEFLARFQSVSEGGLASLQAAQVPEAFLADIPEVAAARDSFLAAFTEAEAGKHAGRAPVNTDTQVGQIAHAYIEDTADVSEARASHLSAFQVAEDGGLASLQAPQVPHYYLEDVEHVAAAKAKFMAAFEMAAAEVPVPAAPVAVAKAALPPQPIVYQQPLVLPYHTLPYQYQIPVQTYQLQHQIPVKTYQLLPFYSLTAVTNTVEEPTKAVEEA